MFRFLTKIFIKDCDNVSDPHVREKYGRLSGIVGLVLNALLCASKIVVGTLTGAISVVSDAIIMTVPSDEIDLTSFPILFLSVQLFEPDKPDVYRIVKPVLFELLFELFRR